MWVGMKQKSKDILGGSGNNKYSVALSGKGKLCNLLIQEREAIEKIEYIIESNPSVQYQHNIPII